MKHFGIKQHTAKKVPFINNKNKKKRLEISYDFLLKPMTFWKKVIWSDETKINFFRSDGNVYVWRYDNEMYDEKCTIKTVKHGGGSIMLWGCMSYNGVGKIVPIEGKLDAKGYVQLLQENLFESAKLLGLEDDFVFQQDNDPKHTSKLASKFFEINNIKKLDWPSQSPDLNVIEHLWSELKRRYGDYKAKNKKELFFKIQEIWIELGSEFPEKLVNSIYKRCIAVMEARGGNTRY